MNCSAYPKIRPLNILERKTINLLVDEIKSTLGTERTEVMSMEGIEASYFDSMLSGVFYEVESERSDPSHEAVCFS